MIPFLRTILLNYRFRKAFADLTERESQAKLRGDTRAIGNARRERRERIHRALGWRGTMRA